MNARGIVDVQPLGRLLFRPRAALGAIGVGALVLGVGWIGLAARFNAVRERSDDADFVPLLFAAGIVMLPALFGAVASEAMHEVLRRPATSVLPGLRRRLRASTLLFALAVSLAVAVGFGVAWPGLAPHEAAGPALLGVAVGAWVMVRVGGAGFWLARLAALAALAWFAGPVCTVAADSPLAGAAFALAGLALLALRLRPDVMRASLFQEAPTFLTVLFATGRATSSVPRAQVESGRAPGEVDARHEVVLPPARLGGSLAGWARARRFELTATRNQIGTFGGVVRFAFLSTGIALVSPLVSGWLEGELGLAQIARTLVGSLPGADPTDGTGPTSFIFVLGMFAGMTAWVGSVPLLGSFLFPIGRSMRARLAFRVALTTFAYVFVATLIAGATLGAIVLLADGSGWPRALPVFAWSALANLAVMPWIQVGVHVLSRLVGRIPFVVTAGAVPIGLSVLYFSLAEVREAWGSDFGGLPVWQVALGYVALLGASLAFLRVFLSWHFRTCDLVRD